MFIDCHTHAFADKIADKAVEQLINYYSIPTVHGGRFSDLLHAANSAGLDAMVLLVAATKPEQVRPANDWALYLSQLSEAQINHEFTLPRSPRIFPFGTFHPGDSNWLSEIRRLRSAGIKGIKLHPEFQGIDLGDPGLSDFWAEVENDFILMIHVGDPVISPENYSTPLKIARILDNFPKMRIIAAHLGGYHFWDDVCAHLAGKDVWLDTSSSLPYIHPSQLRDIFNRHPREKILFGSDYPLRSPQEELELLEKLEWLTVRDRELIYGENCAQLLGI